MFCYQQSFFTPTKEVTREQFWALVGAPFTKECIDAVRAAKARGDDAEAARLKKRLPAFIFQATFDVTRSKSGLEGRWRKQAATRLNGLCVLDVDHVDEPRKVFDGWGVLSKEFRNQGTIPQSPLELKNQRENPEFPDSLEFRNQGTIPPHSGSSELKNQGIIPKFPDSLDKKKTLERILLVYVTPSGFGLKVVFKADPKVGNLIDNMNAMASVLGVEADQSCKDASRMSFICTREDILFINENELFTYEDKEFAEKFEPFYRGGNSQPTVRPAEPAADADGGHAAVELRQDGRRDGVVCQAAVETYHGVSYADIISEWLGGSVPQPGDRHTTLLRLARDLRYICDRRADVVRRVLMQQQWVRDLAAEGDAVDQTIKDACDYKYYATVPKQLRDALQKVGAVESEGQADDKTEGAEAQPLPLDEWGAAIGELFDSYPCLREALGGLPVAGRAAGLFVTGAFMGTLMTRTWYYFYHRPEELRRLNYCVMVIGDPASGKSFATRLYKLIAAPIKTADKVGYDALNRYKEEMRTKGSNKEKPKKPVVIIRDHPARTSNAQFIQDMNNAVEVVDGEPMHLHLLTFDSELDNATLTQRGGSWIDKTSLELKAFHNEEDGQAYSNLDSVSGTFNVYWNFVYTGTPLSLQRKVTERNFGSGLATRLACIPLPPSGFRMMELSRQRSVDHEADDTLKTWAFRLDGVKGELPLWPIVEEAWQWTAERMEVAAYNQDKADELLLKRVAYYGVCVTAPFLMMRHWQEWQDTKTFTIDDTDRRLARLVMDIQYRCQQHFFGAYAQAYFDNMERDRQANRQHASKYDAAYQKLPREFSVDDVRKQYGIGDDAAKSACYRLCRDGYIERIKQGLYRKLKLTLN